MSAALRRALLAAAALAASPARAHHGVAAVGAAGAEGPGAAIETTSPLPLPQGLLFAMARAELVPFRRYAVAEPENKSYSWFNTLALGYGIVPWLTAYVFQPVNAKAQDGLGANVGPGDTAVMLALGFKYDERFLLVPEKESLDDLADWHFGVWLSVTVPDGSTRARDARGEWFAPDMQTGFAAPSEAGGATAMRQLSSTLTWLAEASWHRFEPGRYAWTRYRFGDEVRLNTAAVWRAFAGAGLRVDLCAELNGLHLERDREEDAAGDLAPLRASGGDVLYATLGARAYRGPFTAALGVKRAAWVRLNEQPEQQGAEGLEAFRAVLTLSWATRLF